MKEHPDVESAPHGMHAVAYAGDDAPKGVIYVLKATDKAKIDEHNQLHPFYMVYIGIDGEVICNHASPKKLLDSMRHICRGKSEPIPELYRAFNRETDDGRDMSTYSELLKQAVGSIIEVKETADINSLFKPGGTTLLSDSFKGLSDFELITFLVVR